MKILNKKERRARRFASFIALALPAVAVTPLAMVATATEANAVMHDNMRDQYDIPSFLAGQNNLKGSLYSIPLNTADGYPGWCVQSGTEAPGPDEILNKDNISTSTPKTVNAPADLALTPPQMAWVLTKAGKQMDDVTESAVAYLVHANYERASNVERDPQAVVDMMVSQISKNKPHIHAKAVALVRDARANTVKDVQAGEIETENYRIGFFNNIGVIGDDGKLIPDVPVRITINGPAVFKETGTKVWTGKTKTTPVRLEWIADGNGDVEASHEYRIPHRKTITLLDSGDKQDLLTIGNRPGSLDPEVVTKNSTPFRTKFNFQPIAVSNVGNAKVSPDGALSDTITVSANTPDGEWIRDANGKHTPVTFEGVAYWVGEELPVEANEVPAGATEVGRVTVTADGPGVYDINLPKKANPGFVNWVWKVVKANQAGEFDGTPIKDLIKGDWSDKFGLADETTSVQHKVEVDTTLVHRVSKAGIHFGDDVWVQGFPGNHGEFKGGAGFKADNNELKHTLLFFPKGLELVDANAGKAEVIGEVTTPAKNGYFQAVGIGELKAKADNPVGTYVFVTEFTGDDRVKAFKSSVTDKTEQFTVEPEPVEIKTTATDKADGDKYITDHGDRVVTDKIEYKNLNPGEEYTVKGALMNVDTRKPLLDKEGKPVVAEKVFTPGAKDGFVELDFKIDNGVVIGDKVVVFEEVYNAEAKLVAEHKDFGDSSQTVTKKKVEIKTTATDKKDGDKFLDPDKEAELMDKICMDGLIPNAEYEVETTLVYADSGKPVEILNKGNLKFSSNSSKTCVNVTAKVDGSKLEGKKVVFLEKLKHGGFPVASHEDLNDKDQTVEFKRKPLATTGVSGMVGLGSVIIGSLGFAGVQARRKFSR